MHGTSKKKLIEDKLTLVQFSDVEINKEGYWNNNQIALQVEDIYDVISVKFKNNFVDNSEDKTIETYNVDFVIMMDQSSGHGIMCEGVLN